jgi:hypothetical protein
MEENTTRQIYTDIHSILDLRIGAVGAVCSQTLPQCKIDILSDPAYYLRDVDMIGNTALGYLNEKEIRDIHLSNPGLCLNESHQTKIVPFIRHMLYSYYETAATDPSYTDITLEINFYPFDVDDDFAQQLTKEMSNVFKIPFRINAYSKHIKDVDFSNTVTAFIYNPTEWFNANEKRIKSRALTKLVLYTPKVNRIRAFTSEEKQQLHFFKNDVFEATSKVCSGFFELEFLPIRLFCADSPFNEEDELIKAIEKDSHASNSNISMEIRKTSYPIPGSDGSFRPRKRK